MLNNKLQRPLQKIIELYIKGFIKWLIPQIDLK